MVFTVSVPFSLYPLKLIFYGKITYWYDKFYIKYTNIFKNNYFKFKGMLHIAKFSI